MNKLSSQNKRIVLILMGLVGTMFLWTGGIGAGRAFSGLPTDNALMIIISILGLFMVSFVSSYAASSVKSDE